MRQVRIWLGLLVLWVFLINNIERLHGPLNIASFVYPTVGALAAGLLFLNGRAWLPRSVLWVGAVALCLGTRLLLGYPFEGVGLPLAVMEVCLILVTLLMVDRVLFSLETVQRVAEDAVTIQLGTELVEPGRGVEGIQEEIRRARHFSRPLAMLTVSARGYRRNRQLHAILEKAQRDAIDKYVRGCLYRLLQRQTRDCDIVARKNGHYVVLMPESDRDGAQEMLQRISESAYEEIGLNVNAGIATFPDEELTLVGLLERAAGEMDTAKHHSDTGSADRESTSRDG